jgi:hypothetical protein
MLSFCTVFSSSVNTTCLEGRHVLDWAEEFVKVGDRHKVTTIYAYNEQLDREKSRMQYQSCTSK